MSNKVLFRFEEDPDKEVVVEVGEGDTILDAALDNDLHLNHNCGAVCACSTCHVYIDKGMNDLPEISDKEEDFIDRAENPKINSRLACQCIVSSNIEVTIPDQSSIIGH
ncbi:MAG: ferredoxin [Bacteroidetes bacterium]|jgi:2Fe-2S ferredoxin|nr:2Fe-2S iron-sulfur cluster-binding protein [Bacteroidia bacterium]NBV56570.1 ferredoxin [Bacteroidota bacterium]